MNTQQALELVKDKKLQKEAAEIFCKLIDIYYSHPDIFSEMFKNNINFFKNIVINRMTERLEIDDH